MLFLALCAGMFSLHVEQVQAKPLLGVITISNSPSDSKPTVGSNIVFTISINNTDTTISGTNVIVTALLPSGLTYISDDGGGAYNDVTGIWTLAGNLPASGNAVLR
ncbi:MAG: hypothetical protein ACKOBL_08050, partial [Chloroflexota bacterium]